jgi:hypothetical protein
MPKSPTRQWFRRFGDSKWYPRPDLTREKRNRKAPLLVSRQKQTKKNDDGVVPQKGIATIARHGNYASAADQCYGASAVSGSGLVRLQPDGVQEHGCLPNGGFYPGTLVGLSFKQVDIGDFAELLTAAKVGAGLLQRPGLRGKFIK